MLVGILARFTLIYVPISMRSTRLIALILVGIFFLSTTPVDQGTDTATPLKARYLYNFAKLVDWPAAKKKGNFVIGVLNDKGMFDQMTKLYATKKIGSQSIQINSFSSTDNIGKCNILYMPGSMAGKIAEVAAKSKDNNILIVSDSKGATTKGSVINFAVTDNKIGFELSKKNAQAYGLTLGTDIIKFATRVL